MYFLKCCASLTACLLVLCSAFPVPQAPAAAITLSSHGSATTEALEHVGQTNNDLKLRNKPAVPSPDDNRASLSPRNNPVRDLLRSPNQAPNCALLPAAAHTPTTTTTTTTTTTRTTPFATIALTPCGPTIEQQESCSTPPFTVRRDHRSSSAFSRVVARLVTIKAAVDAASGAVARRLCGWGCWSLARRIRCACRLQWLKLVLVSCRAGAACFEQLCRAM
ncbi:MAG: hypothetical protein FRX48_07841 [Lasallia pustulata]|uniref:Uncharacterized protein n=1 Tax=Lasallia pustulata TaxID=136370 RepID=A0A5M8PGS6_9LECA|nr:MAG: hypothetical protein FRX48_07841 [Lasallia pustulata]